MMEKLQILANEELASIANLVLRKTTVTLDGENLIDPDKEIMGLLSEVPNTAAMYRERVLMCIQAIIDAELGYFDPEEREHSPVGFDYTNKQK